MMKKEFPRPHPLVVPLVRHVLLPFLARRARLSAVGLAALEKVTPPYLVVANHANVWDPFWINFFVRHPIQFVSSDNLFRTFFLGLAMRLLGAIPKTKLMNDPEAVRAIFGVLRAGGVVGIFPEGCRSYDGRTSPLVPAVCRLVRRLRVPVIGARIFGGYLSRPRWARNPRRGAVQIVYDRLFTGEDLARLTEDEVSAVLSRHLACDDVAWQRTRMVQFRSRRPAEFLERLLFICPHCRSVSRLTSVGDRVRCTGCEYAVRVNRHGFLVPCTGPLYFDSPSDWNIWQLQILERMLAARGPFGEFIFEESPSRLLTGFRTRPLRRMDTGTARLTRERILFDGKSGSTSSFRLAEVQGMNVQNREKLEFYHERILYRLDFLDPRASSYKWEKAVELLAGTEGQARSLIRVNTY
jgi:1-acyl-sn-glycerol-3-phosphate acyltransferase